MSEFTSALGEMDLSSFVPVSDVEADDKSCRIAQTAALSRRCPIQDAADYWLPLRTIAGVARIEFRVALRRVGTFTMLIPDSEELYTPHSLSWQVRCPLD
jgi:hypothetical protein